MTMDAATAYVQSSGVGGREHGRNEIRRGGTHDSGDPVGTAIDTMLNGSGNNYSHSWNNQNGNNNGSNNQNNNGNNNQNNNNNNGNNNQTPTDPNQTPTTPQGQTITNPDGSTTYEPPPPPGYAYAINPLTGKKELVDLTPSDPTKPLGGWHWVIEQGQNYNQGHWVFNETPDVLDKPYEGVPPSVIPWLKVALDNGGDLSQVPEGPTQAWLNYLFNQALAQNRRPDAVPFGTGLPNFTGMPTPPETAPETPADTTTPTETVPTTDSTQTPVPDTTNVNAPGPVAPNAGAPSGTGEPIPSQPNGDALDEQTIRNILGDTLPPELVDEIVRRVSEYPRSGRPYSHGGRDNHGNNHNGNGGNGGHRNGGNLPQAPAGSFTEATVQQVTERVRQRLGPNASQADIDRIVSRALNYLYQRQGGNVPAGSPMPQPPPVT